MHIEASPNNYNLDYLWGNRSGKTPGRSDDNREADIVRQEALRAAQNERRKQRKAEIAAAAANGADAADSSDSDEYADFPSDKVNGDTANGHQ